VSAPVKCSPQVTNLRASASKGFVHIGCRLRLLNLGIRHKQRKNMHAMVEKRGINPASGT
jgi:hypothetical protein